MPAIEMAADATGGRKHMIPRPVLVAVLAALVLLLIADVGAQFVIVGHSASPVLDGGILAIIGTVFTAARGPKPPPPPEHDEHPQLYPLPRGPRGTAQLPRVSGRHHQTGGDHGDDHADHA